MAGFRRLLRAILNPKSVRDNPPPEAVDHPVDQAITAAIGVPEGFTEAVGVALPAPGEVVEVVFDDTVLAVANVDGTLHAITGVCPHAGGPLGEGTVEGLVLWCPFHRWNFHLETGIASVGGQKLVEVYDVRTSSGRLFVRL